MLLCLIIMGSSQGLGRSTRLYEALTTQKHIREQATGRAVDFVHLFSPSEWCSALLWGPDLEDLGRKQHVGFFFVRRGRLPDARLNALGCSDR